MRKQVEERGYRLFQLYQISSTHKHQKKISEGKIITKYGSVEGKQIS